MQVSKIQTNMQYFNIQSTYVNNKDYNNYNEIYFTGLKKIPSKSLHINSIFSKFKTMSASRRYDINPELLKDAKFVRLNTKNMFTELLDINPNNSKKYIIFFHGLGQNVTFNQNFYKSAIDKGYGLVSVEYGGFGNSNGKLTKNSINNTIKTTLRYLQDKGIEDKNIAISGFSMGSIPAINTASKNNNFKFLLLISPFNSLKNEQEFINKLNGKIPKIFKYIMEKFPFLLNHINSTLNVKNKIKKVNIPAYIIHSQNDNVVPPASTQNLAQYLKNLKNLIFVESGGHNIDKSKLEAFNNIKTI